MEKTAQKPTPNKEKRSIPWTGLIVWPFGVFILYLLGVGPFLMMVKKGQITGRSHLLYMYGPVAWAYDFTFLHKPIGMYLHLWVPEDFDKKGNKIP